MSDINIGALSEAINDKMDRDLNNRSTDSGLRKLVESYVNGTSWYKVFDEIQSDGTVKKWCEQGGQSTTNSQATATNFLIPFKDTNYGIITNVVLNGSSAYEVCVYQKNTANFTAYYYNASGTVQFSWKAEGYIS